MFTETLRLNRNRKISMYAKTARGKHLICPPRQCWRFWNTRRLLLLRMKSRRTTHRSCAAFLLHSFGVSGNAGDCRWASPTCRRCGTSCQFLICHHHCYTWQLLPVGSVTVLWFWLPWWDGGLCRNPWSAAKILKATNIQMRKSRAEPRALVFLVHRGLKLITFSSADDGTRS